MNHTTIISFVLLGLTGCATPQMETRAVSPRTQSPESAAARIYLLPEKISILPADRFHPTDIAAALVLTSELTNKGFQVVERLNIGELKGQQDIQQFQANGRSDFDIYLEVQNVKAVVFVSASEHQYLNVRAVEVGTGKVIWSHSQAFEDRYRLLDRALLTSEMQKFAKTIKRE